MHATLSHTWPHFFFLVRSKLSPSAPRSRPPYSPLLPLSPSRLHWTYAPWLAAPSYEQTQGQVVNPPLSLLEAAHTLRRWLCDSPLFRDPNNQGLAALLCLLRFFGPFLARKDSSVSSGHLCLPPLPAESAVLSAVCSDNERIQPLPFVPRKHRSRISAQGPESSDGGVGVSRFLRSGTISNCSQTAQLVRFSLSTALCCL